MILHIQLHLITDFARSHYPESVQEAFTQFFSGINTDKFSKQTMESLFPLFNEWLMFEYRLPNGRTMVVEYFARNTYKHDEMALSELQQIIKTQFFDLFQITGWLSGKWVNAHGIYSNANYVIADIALSNSLTSPGCLHARLAKVDELGLP